MKVKGRGDPLSGAPAYLVVTRFDPRQHLRFAPFDAVRAAHPKKAPRRVNPSGFASSVTGVQEQETLTGQIPRLRVGEVGHENALEFVNGPGLGAAMDVRRTASAVRRGEDP